MLCKSALEKGPPQVNPTDWGGEVKEDVLSPVTGMSQPAPNELMKIVARGCGTDKPCSRNNCSCKMLFFLCTTFCNCGAEENYYNGYTKYDIVQQDENEDDHDGVTDRKSIYSIYMHRP